MIGVAEGRVRKLRVDRRADSFRRCQRHKLCQGHMIEVVIRRLRQGTVLAPSDHPTVDQPWIACRALRRPKA